MTDRLLTAEEVAPYASSSASASIKSSRMASHPTGAFGSSATLTSSSRSSRVRASSAVSVCASGPMLTRWPLARLSNGLTSQTIVTSCDHGSVVLAVWGHLQRGAYTDEHVINEELVAIREVVIGLNVVESRLVSLEETRHNDEIPHHPHTGALGSPAHGIPLGGLPLPLQIFDELVSELEDAGRKIAVAALRRIRPLVDHSDEFTLFVRVQRNGSRCSDGVELLSNRSHGFEVPELIEERVPASPWNLNRAFVQLDLDTVETLGHVSEGT